jgi:hypothetical protein
MRFGRLKKVLSAAACGGLAIIGSAAAGAILFGSLGSEVLHAAWGRLAPFYGTYVGGAVVSAPGIGKVEQRDMDIVVQPYDEDGFQVEWVNVTRVDGRRDVKGVQRHVQRAQFVPSEEGDFFVESGASSVFQERQQTRPMQGDPVRWAAIDGNNLYVYSFMILEDGRYELQMYDRRLVEDGMEIEFRRLVDGELVRQIDGRAARVDVKVGGDE